MIIKYIITLLFIVIMKPTRCSIVHEALNPESTLISHYCPKQRYCSEGTHVVCMYYDHNHVFGPRCGNPVEVEITPKIVQNILANVNEIRSEVATGKEKGKDNEVLPRAYGLLKLEWDKELAFLAQVLANQCLGGRKDLCRATDNFPNPSQTIAVVRYKYPDWEYVRANNSEKGLNEDKLIFAVDKFFKSTHALKKTVTNEIIMNCPPSKELPDLNLRFYLNLIRGGATHIGCGVSAYSNYRMNKKGDSMQNNVQIVCNISDSPKTKHSVYNTVPPIPGQGHSKRCGCPRGYKETRSCLCERDPSFHWRASQHLKNIEEAILKQDQDKDDATPKVQQGSSEEKDEQNNGIESPHTTSKSRNIEIREGKITENIHPEAKYGENIETTDEFSEVATGPVMKSSNSQKHKPLLAHTADIFEDLIFKVHTHQEKNDATESTLDVQKENLVGNVNEKTVKFREQNDHYNIKHERLLSILDQLEEEVKNLEFDNNLKQIFDSKMRKIYDSGVNRGQQNPLPTPLGKKLTKKNLHERRAYLETESNKSIEDEIDSLRKMIQHWSKRKEEDYKTENENDPNQNHNVAQQLDAYRTLSNRRRQIIYPYSRKSKKNLMQGALHQILVRRPSHDEIDALRISVDQPRQTIYSSESDTYMI